MAKSPNLLTPAGRTDALEVEALIWRWDVAVHAGNLETVAEDHDEDIVMFDVPPPDEGVRELAAYRDRWPPFFEWQRRGAVFEITELEVAAGDDVAFVWALLRCGPPDELASDPATRLRLTIGLRKQEGRLPVTHEHDSFPNRN